MTAKKRRKKKRSSGGGIIFLVTLLLIAFVSYKWVFVIRSVEVSGDSDVSGQEIVRAAELDYGNSIFSYDEEKIRKGIDALGSIRLAGVDRRLPSTVVIGVVRRTPAAVVIFQNSIVVLDEEGYVIGNVDTLPRGCVYVSGMHIMNCKKGQKINAANGQTEAMVKTVAAINAVGAAGYVSELNLEDVSNISITAVNHTAVYIGNTDNIETKVAWMEAAVSDLVSREQTGGKLDVSSGTKADYSKPVATAEPTSK